MEVGFCAADRGRIGSIAGTRTSLVALLNFRNADTSFWEIAPSISSYTEYQCVCLNLEVATMPQNPVFSFFRDDILLRASTPLKEWMMEGINPSTSASCQLSSRDELCYPLLIAGAPKRRQLFLHPHHPPPYSPPFFFPHGI
uniref:Uncharacterized protein n=1 Tax=Manihot esculenta TaxID=3983 RepID=A0A2C9USA4_MANES